LEVGVVVGLEVILVHRVVEALEDSELELGFQSLPVLHIQSLLVLEVAQGLMGQIQYLAPLHLPLGVEEVAPQIA